MAVSKNRGIPKWMVKIRENPIKMDDLGVPLFLETPIYSLNQITRVLINAQRCFWCRQKVGQNFPSIQPSPQ